MSNPLLTGQLTASRLCSNSLTHSCCLQVDRKARLLLRLKMLPIGRTKSDIACSILLARSYCLWISKGQGLVLQPFPVSSFTAG